VTTLFTFPGQGSQHAGMLHALPRSTIVADVLAEASDVLGQDALALDCVDALRGAPETQLALLIAGVASARRLMQEAAAPDAVAGMSIGAYAAAVCAGVIEFADALRLVDRRARLMAAAWPVGHGMTAILGLDVGALAPLIAEVNSAGSPVFLANFDAPAQLVIAGSRAAMERVGLLALARGATAVTPLAIATPSHCPLLEPQARQLAELMASVAFKVPRIDVYSASCARVVHDPRRLADDLARNLARPVLWHDTATLAYERGVRLMVEMAPGDVLTKLATIAFPQVVAVAASNTRADSIALLMERELRA
jgi:malonate decarboxylase epsilon subunit